MFEKTPEKVKWYLSMSRKHIGELKVKLQSFLTWALHGVEWSTSRPGRSVPGEGNSGTNYVIIIIIILVITIINCNWVVTRWQWLFYMYTEYEIGD